MQGLRTIVLAAGKGTRMKSELPKVLHEVCGKSIIQHVLDLCSTLGSQKTYVVLGHKINEIKEAIGKQFQIVEQKNPLGTANAVSSCQSYFKGYRGDVLIVCGDTPLLNKSVIKQLIRKHKKTKSVCTLLTTVLHNPQGYGRIIRDTSGHLVAIREDKDAVGFERDIAEINVGVYCVNAVELFNVLKSVKSNAKNKEFYLTDIIEKFRESGFKVDSMETDDPNEGLGINTRQDLAKTENIFRRRILNDLMVNGVTVVDPETTYVDASVRIGKDTVLRPFTFIEKDVIIGAGCSIGPFARLRPGTRLKNEVVIGNFTEVSRSKIGEKTIVKHFGFLGDSIIGAGVNIGAGTVTANYNGVEKNITRIGDGAFIGSDAVLVAPVKIGKKAVIGAGSVLTKGKNVADGTTVVGVPAKTITKGKRS